MAQAGLATADKKTKAYALTRAQMNNTALHSLIEKANALPVGSPERQQADQQIGILSSQIQSDNYDIMDRAESVSKLQHGLFNSNPGNSPEQTFDTNQRLLELSGHPDLAKYNNVRHLPGVGDTNIEATEPNKDRVNKILTFQNQVAGMRNWINAHQSTLDKLNPETVKEGQAKAADLLEKYNAVKTGGGVLTNGRHDYIQSIIDPNPTKFLQNLRPVLPQLEATQNESYAELQQLLKNMGSNNINPKINPSWSEKKSHNGVQYQHIPAYGNQPEGWQKVQQ
jgi:hypothetical protein